MNPSDTTKSVKQMLAGVEPPDLGPGIRSGTRSEAELETAFNSLAPELQLPETNRELIRALVLLWHDHLAPAHHIAQEFENQDGNLVHAIMHRREPDSWNSKYWWRRVGKHPCFPEIARRMSELLKSKGEHNLAGKLIPRGQWDAFAFVDACEAAAKLPVSDERVQLLREIQRIEFEVALEYFAQRGAS